MMGVDSTQNERAILKEIRTFVFLDMETTGLFNNPRMLELSMVAISRTHLLEMKNCRKYISTENGKSSKILGPPPFPRVLHKFLRLYYPKVMIYPDSEQVHGLNNDLLHELPPFTSSSAEAILKFLDLPKPICFVAHNGLSYDYKILKAELENIEMQFGFDEILCLDSLHGIKHLDKMEEEDEILAITELAEIIFETDMFESEKVDKQIEKNGSSQEDEPKDNIYKTPEKKIINCELTTPQTPQKKNKPAFETSSPIQSCSTEVTVPAIKNKSVKRSLCNKSSRLKQFKPYTQSAIYTRLFGVPFVAHRAESDALALMQICSNYGEKFTQYADGNAKSFSIVKPRWAFRKSFKI